MINWLKKLNRSKNYYLKKQKINLKLSFLSATSTRSAERAKDYQELKTIALPFIGKGIGDAIVISGIIDTLVKNGYKVLVIADKRTHFLFKEWTNIHKLFLYDQQNKRSLINELKNSPPFIFVDSHEITYASVYTFDLIKQCTPAKVIGFTSKYKLYDSIVNISNPLGHTSTRYIDLLAHLGIKVTDYDYTVLIPEDDKNKARDFIHETTDKKIISFIPYGSVSERFFSTVQINAITKHLSKYNDDYHVIIIGEQHKIKDIEESVSVTKNTTPSFFSAAQIIKDSALVISPDTSFVHLSRAFNKKLICIYPFKILVAPANNVDVWGPNYEEAVQIALSERRIMDAEIEPIIDIIDREINKL